MNFKFRIEYKTQWGEELRIAIGKHEYPLNTENGVVWTANVELTNEQVKKLNDCLTYKYILYRYGQLVWAEWDAAPHKLIVDRNRKNKTIGDEYMSFTIDDLWRPIPQDLPLFSAARTECTTPHTEDANICLTSYNQTLQLRVVEPRLGKGEHLGIVGNTNELGNWINPIRMTLIGLQEYAVNWDASKFYKPIEYKYVILDDNNRIIRWENGENRCIPFIQLKPGQTWIKTDNRPKVEYSNWKCAGVVIPVFSLRSEGSCGIGDFGDLKAFIQWAAHTGMHAVQILPINDTTMDGSWQDSYPYNAISIYAFHPIYCDIRQLPALNDKLLMESYLIKQQTLNDLDEMDYEQVWALKRNYLHNVYKQEGQKILASEAFNSWYQKNKEWLIPYAAFSYLRDTYHTPDFKQWPLHSTYHKDEIEGLCQPTAKQYNKTAFYIYVQYLLHLQLTEVRNTARKLGIILKGDIPIGIARTSVEAWTDSHLFNLDRQTGAPPDDFSVNGQNWGFPTYNWNAMQKDGCAWWMKRMGKMSEYFDAYRIDHVLGFFRIWSIPLDSVHGLLGQFDPAMPMTRAEIESYGLHFVPSLFTHPIINDYVLQHIFGYQAELVKTLYLNEDEALTREAHMHGFLSNGGTLYQMKPAFDTQRKVKDYFDQKDGDDSHTIREGLYRLISNVLFVTDKTNQQAYHPRIAAQKDLVYEQMNEADRKAFDALYEDYYYRRHDHYWYAEAMKKLPKLTQSTRMLVCAEDLGMVPGCVAWVMEQLRILSLEIQTMPKAFGVEFGNLATNPYLSVATISTHDMPTLRQWWEEDNERAQRFFNQALCIDGPAPKTLPAWLAEEIVCRHLYSPSILCLLSFQDWTAIDEQIRNPKVQAERINIPAHPRHYWRYRMHITIEQLMKATSFNKKVKELIDRSGR